MRSLAFLELGVAWIPLVSYSTGDFDWGLAADRRGGVYLKGMGFKLDPGCGNALEMLRMLHAA